MFIAFFTFFHALPAAGRVVHSGQRYGCKKRIAKKCSGKIWVLWWPGAHILKNPLGQLSLLNGASRLI
jgi:hypothetical protein